MAKVGAQGLWVAGAPQKAQPGAPRAPSCCHQGCGQHGTSWAPAPRVTPRNGCRGMPDLGVGKRERWSCRSNHEHPQLRKQPDEDVTYLGPLQDPVRSFFPAQRQG